MSKLEVLIREATEVPDTILDEVLDFLRFVKSQRFQDARETLVASEDVLGGDWLSPEEDAAWQDL